ncbi:MAG: peptidoglycan DD-metalloendopeptidase family protein [Alphaproteobacteria bacterium]
MSVLSVTMVVFASIKVVKHYKKSNQQEVAASNQPKINEPNTPKIQETTLILAKGSNIEKMLIAFGAEKSIASQIATSLEKHLPNKSLKAGQNFNVSYTKDESGLEIKSFAARPSVETKLFVSKNDGTYSCQVEKIKLTPAVHVFEGNLNSSFYSSAIKAGVPVKLVQEAVDVLSNVINFQHGIKAGASFRIQCNTLNDSNGNVVQIKQLKYVSLKTGGADYKMFAYEENGKVRFFDEKGSSMNRSLLQTPLNATKLCVTSGFGMRRHPIQGYTKMHKGVDFGAPTGTPVLAAGDGRVTRAGWYGGYGNCVEITHTSGYRTLYGHLSRINVKCGTHVGQRQQIGAVGTTGNSTGPHLHFEVLLNGRNINPMKVQSLPTLKLTGVSLKKFESAKQVLEKEFIEFVQTKAKVSL